MFRRLKILGIVTALIGVAFVVAGGYSFMKVQEGYRSLNAFSAAQNVPSRTTRTASSSTAAKPPRRRPSWRC